MGLAIAEPLSRLGGWHIHLLDLNAERGEQAAKDVAGAEYHQADII